MTGKLALPTFVMGPEDKVAAVDVYTETKDTVVNSIQDTAPTEEDSILKSAIRGGKSMLKELPAALQTASTVMSALSSGNPMQRIANISTLASGALTKLSPDISKSIMGTVGAVTSPVMMAVGSVSRLIPGGSIPGLNNISVLTGTMNQMTGNSFAKMTDGGGLIATASGLINTAAGYGIPNSFSAFASAATIGQKLNIASNILPGLSKLGDIVSTSDVAKSLPFDTLKNLPSFSLTNMASSYMKPTQCTANDYLSEYGAVKTGFSSINSGWNIANLTNTFTGVKTQIPSITTMMSASNDLKSIFDVGAKLSNVAVDKFQLLANTISSKPNSLNFTDVFSGLGKFFPTTAITSSLKPLLNLIQDPVVSNISQSIPDASKQAKLDSEKSTKQSQTENIESQMEDIKAKIASTKGTNVQFDASFQRRIAAAKTDAERAQIQSDYENWKAREAIDLRALEQSYANASSKYDHAISQLQILA